MTSPESAINPPDIVAQLSADHDAASALLSLWEVTPSTKRAEYFCELVPTLVGHEVAEEEVVYPAIRAVDTAVHALVSALLAEQAAAAELLSRMEGLDVQSAEFVLAMEGLRASVLAHADREEVELFPLLDEHAEALDRATLAVRYLQAKIAAPTHPHPHAPQRPPGNLIVTPVAAVVDSIRDAVRAR